MEIGNDELDDILDSALEEFEEEELNGALSKHEPPPLTSRKF